MRASPPPPVIEGPSGGGGGSWEERDTSERGPKSGARIYAKRLTRDDNSFRCLSSPCNVLWVGDVIEVDPVCLKYSLKNNKRVVYTCNEEKLLNVREMNVN